MHQTLHKALKQAATDGLLARNVAEFVKAPRPAKNEIRYLNRDQVHTFLGSAKGDRLEALYVLAITTGMRQGELLALRWEDINLERRTLQVRRTLAAIKDGVAVYRSPKSGRGRSIKLSGTAVEALRLHRTAQGEERTWVNDRWEDHGLVFSDAFGRPLRRWTLCRRSFEPLLERAGLLGAITFHALRHTCATLMLAGGVHVKVVQEMLGHADVALTLNVYSHVLPNLQDEAARRVDQLLS